MVKLWFLQLNLLRAEEGVSTRRQETPTVQFLDLWILGINGDDLPIHFSLIDQGQDAQNLHLDDLTWKTHLKTRSMEQVTCQII